jgi:hypothetical protein
MACAGAPGEACGGPDRLSLYERTSTAPAQSSAVIIDDGAEWVWLSRGCYSDLTYARILANGVSVQGGGNNNSAQSCTTECQRQNYQFAGTEYAAECESPCESLAPKTNLLCRLLWQHASEWPRSQG